MPLDKIPRSVLTTVNLKEGDAELENLLADRLLRATEVARILQVSRSQVYSLVKQGKLPYITINKAIRIPSKALNAWLEQKTVLVQG